MTTEEFDALIRKAEKQLGEHLPVSRNEKGWSVMKTGPSSEDVDDGTLAEVVAKLKEWATPPRPDSVTITIPFDHALTYSQQSTHPHLAEKCANAISPWIKQKS